MLETFLMELLKKNTETRPFYVTTEFWVFVGVEDSPRKLAPYQ